VDRSLLPDIFALIVFIAGFRPLVRRVGPHANLWFLGWGFVLLHYLALLFSVPAGMPQKIAALVAIWAMDLCGLVFLLVSANVPKKRIGRRLLLGLAVPVLLQSALCVFAVKNLFALTVSCLLFLIPAVHLLVRPRDRTRELLILCGSFGVFGLAMLPVALHGNSQLVMSSALSLLIFNAAYLFFTSAEQYSRGVIAATVGLVGWALSYPVVEAYGYLTGGGTLDRSLIELPQYLVVAGIMITLLEQHVERTERMAMHDPLTDLPNRRLFEERLIATMEEARINRTTIACLVIDVDNFKTINDTLGHSAGDQLLRALAVRLSWHMSPRDILARTGGDEFTALLAGVTDEHHLRFIASAMMSAGSVPISIDGKPVDLRISIGIALSPDHADDIDSLRRAADQAMYSAKRRGGSMLAFADED
jgi:diguanylate cyclase (GGDEF)-like protein